MRITFVHAPVTGSHEVTMSSARFRSAAVLTAVLFAGAAPVAAQRISIAPTVGVYIPTTELFKAVQGEEFKQEVSVTLGGRLGLWFGDRLGLEFTGDYAPSKLKFTTAGQNDDGANLFTGTGKATYFIIPNTRPVYFAVKAGVGYIRRSGEFYEGVNPATGVEFTDDERQDWTGTGGATVGFRLGRLLHLSVSADALVYKSNVTEESDAAATPTQKDIQLKFGVGIPLLGFGS
jgi:hypothetical protein